MTDSLHWHNQVNSIAVKLNIANALLLKIRNYVNTKTLRNIYFAIFDSHLSYSCIVWAQNINTVRRLNVLQQKALRIMNLKDQLFYSSPLFSWNNILKFGNKITLENILCSSVNLSTGKSLLYLKIGLHSQEIYIGMKHAGRQLTILIFQLFEPKNMFILV